MQNLIPKLLFCIFFVKFRCVLCTAYSITQLCSFTNASDHQMAFYGPIGLFSTDDAFDGCDSDTCCRPCLLEGEGGRNWSNESETSFSSFSLMQVVTTVEATDRDSGVFGQVVYSLEAADGDTVSSNGMC